MSFFGTCVITFHMVFGVPNVALSFDPCPPLPAEMFLNCQFSAYNGSREDIFADCRIRGLPRSPTVYSGKVWRLLPL